MPEKGGKGGQNYPAVAAGPATLQLHFTMPSGFIASNRCSFQPLECACLLLGAAYRVGGVHRSATVVSQEEDKQSRLRLSEARPAAHAREAPARQSHRDELQMSSSHLLLRLKPLAIELTTHREARAKRSSAWLWGNALC